MDFIQLYTTFFQPLTRYAHKFAGDQTAAEDLAQEASCRAYQRLEEFSSLSTPQQQAWLFRTTRNCFFDQVRRQARQPEPEEEPVSEDDLSAVTVRQCLDVLDPDARRLVVLRYFVGWNSTQLAQQLGIPAATVRTRLRAAAKKLKQAYLGESPQGGTNHGKSE